MVIQTSQARMSVSNMVGGVILIIILFIVIIVCMFNLRYYIWEGNRPPERINWRSWFSFKDHEEAGEPGPVSKKSAQRDLEKGDFGQNSTTPLTVLDLRSTKRRASRQMQKMSIQTPSIPYILANDSPKVTVPPTVVIRPPSRKDSEASDQSFHPPVNPSFLMAEQQTHSAPRSSITSPLPAVSRFKMDRPSSSFEATTGIGMGPSYHPPVISNPPVTSRNDVYDLRQSIATDFADYFNPYAWMATQETEGADLDVDVKRKDKGEGVSSKISELRLVEAGAETRWKGGLGRTEKIRGMDECIGAVSCMTKYI